MQRIFFDNAATTPLAPAVAEAMHQAMLSLPGNPSAIYAEGRSARAAVEQARKTVAGLLGASIGEIFFTSGGTESNNMALKCAVRDLGVRRIISSPLEHHCVLHTLQRLQGAGHAQVLHVATGPQGQIDLAHLEALLAEEGAPPTLVSLMHANNEIGTMIDLPAVAALCQAHGALFHSDTVQTLGYFPIDLSSVPVSFLSGSAHKFNGPKGVGFVYVSNRNIVQPFIDGGSQERNMRGGTENVYGIIGLAKALELAYAQLPSRQAHISALREHFRQALCAHFPDVEFNGDLSGPHHYKILSASFPPSPRAEMLLFNLDIAGISVSGGSACSSGIDVGSHVIAALHGDSPRQTLRFSFGYQNTMAEADRVIQELARVLG